MNLLVNLLVVVLLFTFGWKAVASLEIDVLPVAAKDMAMVFRICFHLGVDIGVHVAHAWNKREHLVGLDVTIHRCCAGSLLDMLNGQDQFLGEVLEREVGGGEVSEHSAPLHHVSEADLNASAEPCDSLVVPLASILIPCELVRPHRGAVVQLPAKAAIGKNVLVHPVWEGEGVSVFRALDVVHAPNIRPLSSQGDSPKVNVPEGVVATALAISGIRLVFDVVLAVVIFDFDGVASAARRRRSINNAADTGELCVHVLEANCRVDEVEAATVEFGEPREDSGGVPSERSFVLADALHRPHLTHGGQAIPRDSGVALDACREQPFRVHTNDTVPFIVQHRCDFREDINRRACQTLEVLRSDVLKLHNDALSFVVEEVRQQRWVVPRRLVATPSSWHLGPKHAI